MSYYNADGLRILTDNDQGAVNNKGVSSDVDIKTLVVDVDLTADIAPVANDPFIPAGAYIKSATAVVTEAAVGGIAGDDDDQEGGGLLDRKVYVIAALVAFLILVARKSIPLCGALLVVIILYFANRSNPGLLSLNP